MLGSILSSAYATGMDGAVVELPPDAAAAASDSVGAAHEVAVEVGGSAGTDLLASSHQAFVDAMSTSVWIAAGIVVVGAVIAAAFLPARAPAEAPAPAGELLEPAPA